MRFWRVWTGYFTDDSYRKDRSLGRSGHPLYRCSTSYWENNVNRACVCIHNNLWYMWYTGMNNAESRIGLAVSKDGINFKRSLHNPVLLPELDFENKSVMNPCVLWDEQKNLFRMWYSAGEKYEPDVICYAESKDGVSWAKNTAPVLTKGLEVYDKYKVGGCDVHKTANGYVMYFIGYQNIDNARICKATSKDGINWRRSTSNPIISPSKDKWDSEACYKPAFYYSKKENKSYIFYNGRKGHTETIGFAYKEGNDLVDE